MKNELSTKFYGVFDELTGTYKVTKFRMTLVTSSTRMNIHNMLIVAYM